MLVLQQSEMLLQCEAPLVPNLPSDSSLYPSKNLHSRKPYPTCFVGEYLHFKVHPGQIFDKSMFFATSSFVLLGRIFIISNSPMMMRKARYRHEDSLTSTKSLLGLLASPLDESAFYVTFPSCFVGEYSHFKVHHVHPGHYFEFDKSMFFATSFFVLLVRIFAISNLPMMVRRAKLRHEDSWRKHQGQSVKHEGRFGIRGVSYSWHQMYSTPGRFPIDSYSKQVVQH